MLKTRDRAAIYTRVSTAHQVEKHSLPAQRRILRKQAETQGWTVVEEYEDPGISAETIEARPAFQKLLADAESRRFDRLLVIDLDRLTRSKDLRAWATITETLREGGVRIVTPSQEIDLDDEDDSFIGALFALLSGREKQKILRRTRRGQEQAVRQGQRLGGKPPFGYRYDRNKRKLVANESEAPAVPVIYEQYLSGRTQMAVAQELDRRGLSARSAKSWRPNVIRQILRSPIYTGYLVWNRSNQTRTRWQHRPSSEWVWSEEPAHKALIDRATWDRAQLEMRRRGHQVTQPSYLESEYLLTGLVRCWCGERMGGHSTVRRKPDGSVRKRYRRYLCQGFTKGKERHPAVNADKVEGEVLRTVESIAATPELLEGARKKLLLDRMRADSTTARDLDGVREELEAVRRKQGVLYEDRLEGRIPVEQWGRFNADLLAQEEDLVERLERQERAMLSETGGPGDVSNILTVLQDFRRVFDALDRPQKKLLLRGLVADVRVNRTKDAMAEVVLHSPWMELLNHRETPARPRIRAAQ